MTVPRWLVWVLVLVLVLLVLYRVSLGSAAGRAASSPALRVAPGASVSPRSSAVRTVCSVFGSRCSSALRVVSCETGGTFNARALGRAGERGLFQIHPVWFARFDGGRLFEPLYNARAAFVLSRGGRDWSAWTCRP